MISRQSIFILLGGLVILIATAVSYAPAVRGGFIWDDDKYVVENRTLSDFDGLRKIWLRPRASRQYYPMVFTTFWLERQLQGGDTPRPGLFHITNIALHIISALLLWLVLVRLGIPGAWLAAAIFALHPVNVESVAWITERKNVLSLVFYLSSLLCFMRFSGIDRNTEPSDPSSDAALPRAAMWTWSWYAAALLLFVLALLSKSVTCSLPATILLLMWWKRGRWNHRTIVHVVSLIPWFVVGALLAYNTTRLEKYHVGTQYLDFGLAWDDRIVLAGQVVWFYFYKLIWPADLAFFYERWNVSAAESAQWLFGLAAIALLAALWALRKRIGKGPLVAALVFGGTLVPALGFIDVFPMIFSWVADHFQYHASIAIIALLAASATIAGRAVWKRFAPDSVSGSGANRCIAAVVPVAAVLTVLGLLTWRQTFMYRDVETLWTTTIERNPRCSMALVNLGQMRAAAGDTAQANAFYRRVTTMDPPEPVGYMRAMAHYNLGQNERGAARYREAIIEYDAAVKAFPLYINAYYGRGVAYERLGRFAEAADDYRKTLGLNGNHSSARQGLARVRQRLN